MQDEITTKDKCEVLRNEQLLRKAGTYHGVASADIQDERGGRYSGMTRPSVIGSSPVIYPPQPSTSPWHKDFGGLEPPLGFSVEDQPVTGEIWEQERSRQSNPHETILKDAPEQGGTPNSGAAPAPIATPRHVGAGASWRRI
jgi:hypothetical protein